jgi:hypothetical protein
VLRAYCVRLARIVKVIVRDCVKDLCYTLARRRRNWKSACKSPIFCGVEIGFYVPVRSLTQNNK